MNSCHKKHIGMLIKCVDKKIVQQLNNEFEKYDLTLSQFEVLAYLMSHQDEGAIYQKHIEEYLDSSNPTITGIVKRLEMKELLKREASSHDGRYRRLILTEKGKELFEEVAHIGPIALEMRMTQYLGADEVDKLIELLHKALKGLDEA